MMIVKKNFHDYFYDEIQHDTAAENDRFTEWAVHHFQQLSRNYGGYSAQIPVFYSCERNSSKPRLKFDCKKEKKESQNNKQNHVITAEEIHSIHMASV